MKTVLGLSTLSNACLVFFSEDFQDYRGAYPVIPIGIMELYIVLAVHILLL